MELPFHFIYGVDPVCHELDRPFLLQRFQPKPSINERRYGIDKTISPQKLAHFSTILRKYVRDNPKKSISAGVAAALAGAGIAFALAPIVISTGTVITVTGESLAIFGVVVAGLGLLFGVMGRSSSQVAASLLKCGLFAIGAGGAIMLAGLLITGIGYGIMIAGGALAVAGLGVAGYAVYNQLSEPEERAVQEGFETVVCNLSEKEEISDLPLILLDLDNQDNHL